MNDEKAADFVREKIKDSKINTDSAVTSFVGPQTPKVAEPSFHNTESGESEGLPIGSLLQQAKEAAEKIKLENDRHEALLRKQEEIQTRSILGGKSEGGIQAPVKTEEELKKERANEFLKSTGLKIF